MGERDGPENAEFAQGRSTPAFGGAAVLLLVRPSVPRPQHIHLLHARTTPTERGESDGGQDRAVSVWVRAVWRDGSELLGFVSVEDAKAIAKAYRRETFWFSRLVAVSVPLRRRSMIALERLDALR